MNQALGVVLTTVLATTAAEAACENGLYGFGGRDAVVINNPLPAASANPSARYLLLDGRRGDVDAADSPVRCEQGRIHVQGADGTSRVWEKIPLTVTPSRFTSYRTQLSGFLIERQDTTAVDRPLVVLVHGSEKTSIRTSSYPSLFAAQGLMVFAYDKRGTGESQGDYTQNFELLADDAIAALQEAKRLAAGRYSRAGFFGGSQGGWIAPLAAKRSQADFVAVGFGLVLTPLEEDQEQVATELRQKGYGADVLAQAREITDATGAVVASHFTREFDRLARVKKRYGAEPWFHEIQGEFTGAMLLGSEADLRRVGPALLDNLNLIWDYDSVPVLRALQPPVLWVLAEQDREAPSAITRDRLLALRNAGKPIDIWAFPQTDHGMYEFVEQADGTRQYTRITDGYFRLLGDWIKQDLRPPYGRGEAITTRE